MSDRPSFIPAFLPPLSPEAWRVIPWFAIGTLILFWIWTPLGWVGLAMTVWCVTLFREPVRTPPARPATAVSPVDGQVTAIATLAPPTELNLSSDERACVTIALGPWDSHVARVPCGGRLTRLAHGYGGRGGERVSFVTEGADGVVGTVLVAEGPGRRVRSAAGEGQKSHPRRALRRDSVRRPCRDLSARRHHARRHRRAAHGGGRDPARPRGLPRRNSDFPLWRLVPISWSIAWNCYVFGDFGGAALSPATSQITNNPGFPRLSEPRRNFS